MEAPDYVVDAEHAVRRARLNKCCWPERHEPLKLARLDTTMGGKLSMLSAGRATLTTYSLTCFAAI